MTEIREAALRFAENEAAIFLNETMHLDLAPEDVATLEARTEGWIASLQLAALAMQAPTLLPEDRHEFVSNFAGSDRYVADYLVGEVLDHQPPLIESFLLQTSILDRLNASLCDYVRENQSSQAILEDLERTNLFGFSEVLWGRLLMNANSESQAAFNFDDLVWFTVTKVPVTEYRQLLDPTKAQRTPFCTGSGQSTHLVSLPSALRRSVAPPAV